MVKTPKIKERVKNDVMIEETKENNKTVKEEIVKNHKKPKIKEIIKNDLMIEETKENNKTVKEEIVKKHKKPKKFAKKKLSTNDLLDQVNYSFSRDAVWFKKTLETIDKIKLDLDSVNTYFNLEILQWYQEKRQNRVYQQIER